MVYFKKTAILLLLSAALVVSAQSEQQQQQQPRRLALLTECEPVDCDFDEDCAEGLLCADANENMLNAVGMDEDLAYCNVSVEPETEVCFDPTKINTVKCGRRRRSLRSVTRYYR